LAWQLLNRHRVVTREAMSIEQVPGGFSAVYDVLKVLEERGRVRRGYFVAGLGAAQFAIPAAVDLLRAFRDEPETPQTVSLSATDPANPYGAILRWPAVEAAGSGSGAAERRAPTRSVGAGVILVNGLLAAYIGRADRHFRVFLPEEEPARSMVASGIATALHRLATGGSDRAGMLISEIDDIAAARHPMAPYLRRAGFHERPTGFQAAPPKDGVVDSR
jgi:ATP-dependent Lhr-like helicase